MYLKPVLTLGLTNCIYFLTNCQFFDKSIGYLKILQSTTLMLRRIQISILMLFMAFTGFSQLDTEHYLAPLTSAIHPFIGNAGHQIIYLSTPSAIPVNYTIYDGANNIINSGTVKNGASIAYGTAGEMNGASTDLMIGKNQLNQVLTGRGIRVVAAAPIYCNVRIRSSNNAQAALITAKGKTALGTAFRIGHMPTPQKASNWGLNSLGSKLATFGIYATEVNRYCNFVEVIHVLLMKLNQQYNYTS